MRRRMFTFSPARLSPTPCRRGQDIAFDSGRRVTRLVKKAEAHILPLVMVGTLRSLILLIAAIVFALSGVSGGFVGARGIDINSGDAHHAHMQSATSQARDAGDLAIRHASGERLVASPGEGTLSTHPTNDRADHDHVGGASSCCATASHMVIPVVQYSASLVSIAHTIDAPSSDHETVQVLATRLERPPRAVNRTVIG